MHYKTLFEYNALVYIFKLFLDLDIGILEFFKVRFDFSLLADGAYFLSLQVVSLLSQVFKFDGVSGFRYGQLLLKGRYLGFKFREGTIL
jgi:hypothetical protein